VGLEDFYAPPSEFAERWPFNGVEKVKLGVWFFLASDVIVFGAFLSAAIFVRYNAGWMSWSPLTESLPGLINTFVLITSSFTVILALVAHRNSRQGLLASLGATIALGFTFLGIKMWEWHHGSTTWACSSRGTRTVTRCRRRSTTSPRDFTGSTSSSVS